MDTERGQKCKEGASGRPREAAVDKEAGFGREEQEGRSSGGGQAVPWVGA